MKVSYAFVLIAAIGANGRIAENWHLEDNLTLPQQLGIVGQ